MMSQHNDHSLPTESKRASDSTSLINAHLSAVDNIDALQRMAAGEDVTPVSERQSTRRPRPSRKERMFPGNAAIDLKVRNHM